MRRYSHSIARASERYGIELTVDDMRRIEMMIDCGDPEATFTQRDRDEHWAVKIRGIWLAVLLDRKQRVVKTILPPRCLPYGRSPAP